MRVFDVNFIAKERENFFAVIPLQSMTACRSKAERQKPCMKTREFLKNPV